MTKKLSAFQWIVLAVSIILMFCNGAFPGILGLNRIGMATICIFIATMLLMITCDLIWPLFLSIPAFVVNGVYSAHDAINNSLGNHLMWFVVFCCMELHVLKETGVLKRMAIWLISRPIARKSPWMFLGSLFLAALAMGCFMDCTAMIILFCSLASQIFDELGVRKGDRFGELVVIGLMVFVGMSYGATPIGHPVGVLAIGQFETLASVSFIYYIGVGVIMSLIFFLIFMLLLKYVFRLDVSKLKGYDPSHLGDELPPVSKEEKVSVALFAVTVVLWLAPTVLQYILPDVYTFLSNLGMLFPVWLAMLAMLLIPINGKPLMDFDRCIKEGVSWPAAFSMAVAMMLSSAITNPEAGVTETLTTVLGPMFGNMSPVVFTLIICMTCLVVTNFSSNTVATILTATISIALIQGGMIDGVNAEALCVCLANCAAYAFAFPPGGTYAAYTAGTGWVTPKAMFIVGGSSAVLFGLLFSTLGYQIASLM